ncbi:MAG: glycosyl transferase family 2 [Chloroflexota bacterium]|nr:glycosyltransferase family 2 protein [Caldilinea sp.]GIK72612.1 MAG: glycosyl transferase family 2 [Chloroflexota bacterium]
MRERISVIIPVYNSERFLAEAIQSVLVQTLPPDEIIVVDDGSTDNSAALVAEMPLPSMTELILVRQPNLGPAAARNRGVALASGELLAFLDADDIWLPDKLEQQVAHLARNSAADGVICRVESFVELGGRWPPGRNRTLFEQNPPMYIFSTLLIRRDALNRAGYLDVQLRAGEDTEWFARARDLGLVFDITPAVLLRRRFHSANLSHSAAAATPIQLLHIVRDSLHRRRYEA